MNMWHDLIDTYSSREKFVDTDLLDVDVELPADKTESVMKEHGCLQLRTINPDADTLIIGCGNGRNLDAGSYTFSHISEDSYNSEYSLKHNHPVSAVTIDPSINANPTIVAFFGDQCVSPLFQGKKFTKIIFEGYFSSDQQRYRRSDIEDLLSTGGGRYILIREPVLCLLSLPDINYNVSYFF